ncbi:hypothetical protein AURANDRAFT_58590 [Aureococcus anophagefferens]|uniref:Uncharacterized protein n=1 Tax=Aureococcus anophagefferens TaxID=44056 RepID=F0XWM1_AURAN|nr:hypothetical protein AURANDRAFT_58590 [Aureococcus anophagefferens]EGB12795.1 hypothetical protein AURANDRAFT_58590 [Aureococcus anophagefferens]|eukprot:XP_009032436.1 hypothetical protein AURANDRAFT_58590 [Aureococcus anophagefferens]
MTRVAVVTGANKGIGFHVAQQLLASCTVVILACRDASRGEAAVRRLSDPKARFMQLDIGDEASIATFAAAVEQDVGRVDALVNDAAIAFKAADPTPFAAQTEPTLKINVRGTVALTDALLPLLERSDAGRLVHVASMTGKLREVSRKRRRDFSDPALTTERLLGLADDFAADVAAGRHKAAGWGSSNYGLSKPCVIAHSKILARKYAGSALRVNACCPGYCRTDMSSNRGGRPPEVGARNAVLLALPDCGLNGEFVQDEAVSAW